MPGLLVCFEGVDGSGKSTLIRAIASATSGAFLTREPTHGPHGSALREAFAEGRRLPRDEERRLVEADRRDHVRTVIAPALCRGDIVLCDRSYYSTAAYQGTDADEARRIVRENELFAPRPDILFYLDLPPIFALARIQARPGKPTAPENFESLIACAGRYESIWTDAELVRGIRFVRLDARQAPEVVVQEALRHLEAAVESRRLESTANSAVVPPTRLALPIF